MVQENIFEEFNQNNLIKDWGTFKDSLRAPIHRWFTYPAGFSYKAPLYSFKKSKLNKNSFVYDPFMGTGTTNLVAKSLGINSYGLEAHPFVYRICKTKMDWEINISEVKRSLEKIVKDCEKLSVSNRLKKNLNGIPELVRKCFEERTLFVLLKILSMIKEIENERVVNFLNVGLTKTLREVSTAHTGWPYIAPNKIKTTSLSKNPLRVFYENILFMIDDIRITKNVLNNQRIDSKHFIKNGDSRNTSSFIEDESIDQIFTSPPYLNNFDYADRTRLELYFFGEAKTWGDITKNVRNKLMTSATTQILRNDNEKYTLNKELQKKDSNIYDFLTDSVNKLGELRLVKGGKKSYDYMVIGYFNDMFSQLKDSYRILKKGNKAVYVLGDSAPYGIHIPTDELIGRIGVSVGFSKYTVNVLRARGGKWKKNPQRHKVPLRESIITLFK